VRAVKKLLSAGVAAAALSAAPIAASGADLPTVIPAKAPVVAAVPAYNWSGLYVGLNGGGGTGESMHTDANFGVTTEKFHVGGGLVGGTAGYNFTVGRWIWGIEGDLDWAGIKGQSAAIAVAGGLATYGTSLLELGTVRGRVGYAFDRFLPYLTGGLAVGDVQGSITAPTLVTSATQLRAGWAAGAGVEYGLSTSLSIKAEYLYVGLSSTTAVPMDNVGFRSSIIRAGLNWRFD